MAQPPNTGASTRRVARRGSVACCVALVLALAAATGCSSTTTEEAGPRREARPLPPLRAPEPLPDTRAVNLRPVGGAPMAFPVSVEGGDLVMGGSVVGPGGPVAGATVRLERFVGQRSGTLDVRTNASGRWVAIDVHGGRYRIRAWRAPDLGMAASELHFLAADAEVDLALTVDPYSGADVTGGVDDSDPELGATATVSALATRQQVDGQGIITTAPASGRDATVTGFGPWALDGSPSAAVDEAGRVAWTFICTAPGSVSARVETLGTQTTVSATCVEPVVVEPPVDVPRPDFPVGAVFTPPFDGPIPVGTYTVIDHPGTCALTYEAWTGAGWDPARPTITGTGTVSIPRIARALESLGDAPPCTYERAS